MTKRKYSRKHLNPIVQELRTKTKKKKTKRIKEKPKKAKKKEEEKKGKHINTPTTALYRKCKGEGVDKLIHL